MIQQWNETPLHLGRDHTVTFFFAQFSGINRVKCRASS